MAVNNAYGQKEGIVMPSMRDEVRNKTTALITKAKSPNVMM
jgi:hypothetical protein